MGKVAKCLLAKAIPSPEFCIPTSIERVRRSSLAKPVRAAIAYPSAKPPKCKARTEAVRISQFHRISYFLAARTNPPLRSMKRTETSGEEAEALWAERGKKRLQTTPTAKGRSTTQRMPLNKAQGSTGR